MNQNIQLNKENKNKSLKSAVRENTLLANRRDIDLSIVSFINGVIKEVAQAINIIIPEKSLFQTIMDNLKQQNTYYIGEYIFIIKTFYYIQFIRAFNGHTNILEDYLADLLKDLSYFVDTPSNEKYDKKATHRRVTIKRKEISKKIDDKLTKLLIVTAKLTNITLGNLLITSGQSFIYNELDKTKLSKDAQTILFIFNNIDNPMLFHHFTKIQIKQLSTYYQEIVRQINIRNMLKFYKDSKGTAYKITDTPYINTIRSNIIGKLAILNPLNDSKISKHNFNIVLTETTKIFNITITEYCSLATEMLKS